MDYLEHLSRAPSPVSRKVSYLSKTSFKHVIHQSILFINADQTKPYPPTDPRRPLSSQTNRSGWELSSSARVGIDALRHPCAPVVVRPPRHCAGERVGTRCWKCSLPFRLAYSHQAGLDSDSGQVYTMQMMDSTRRLKFQSAHLGN